MKKYSIVALGELLIDFTELGFSSAGMRIYEQNPGGAPANVLCLAARQGLNTAFIGKVGNDTHGRFLRSVLEREGVCTEGLVVSDDVYTTLAFVSLDESGEREFSFSRDPGADTCLKSNELNEDILSNCRVFHFGSLSLTDEPARSSVFAALSLVSKAGAIISYDPNYRADLWKDAETAVEIMKKPLPLVDVVKVSIDEALLITGERAAERAASVLLSMGPKLVVVTAGPKNVIYAHALGLGSVQSFEVEQIIDTTGAGDAFWGTFLSRLSVCSSLEAFMTDIEEHIGFANAAAALCIGKRGAIPAMPYKEEIELFLNRRNMQKK